MSADAELVREGLDRQPGCPDKTCLACKARQERIDAGERLIAKVTKAVALLEDFYQPNIDGTAEECALAVLKS
jgi:hypothetical protein